MVKHKKREFNSSSRVHRVKSVLLERKLENGDEDCCDVCGSGDSEVFLACLMMFYEFTGRKSHCVLQMWGCCASGNESESYL